MSYEYEFVFAHMHIMCIHPCMSCMNAMYKYMHACVCEIHVGAPMYA